MAKITLADGMVIEGTAEELCELAKAFGGEEVAEVATEKEVPEFKVGDYAKITGAGDKPPYNSHNFPIGSIVKVDEVGDNEYGDRFRGKRIDGVGHGWWVLNEYAVKASDEEVADALGEDAEETAPEPEETPQDVSEGDYVVSSKSNVGITAGKPYKIDKVYSDGEFKFHDDDDDLRFWNVEYDDVTIYRPIEGDPQVGNKILVTDATVANGKYDNGDILTVSEYYFRDTIGEYVVDVEGDKPYLTTDEFVIIERAGEEGVVESEETLRKQFGKGDKVRLLSGGNEHPLYGFKDGKVYEIVEVNPKIHGGERIKIRDGEGRGYALPSQLEKVAEPIEEGDVVRVTGRTYYEDLMEGTLATVFEVDESESGIKRIVIETEDDIDRTSADNLELVAKKADRRDLADRKDV